MEDFIVKGPCLGTPEPYDLQKERNEETVSTDKPFVQRSKKIKHLNACSRYQLTIWISV